MAKRHKAGKAVQPEIERLVSIHGEEFRRIITGFVKFCETYGEDSALSTFTGREEAVQDLLFRLSSPDCLEKYKAPRAPDWVETLQERVRHINGYIHQLADLSKTNNDQSDLIRKLKSENELLQAKIGQPVRKRLPDTRRAITHKFSIGGHQGYLTVGMFDDGSPGELFITMAKEGSTIGGLMDTVGTLTSISLQYGVSVETLAKKFAHQRFEPSGFTTNSEIKSASSVIDYVFRWMELHFVKSRQPDESSV
jgi:hypothetical protein